MQNWFFYLFAAIAVASAASVVAQRKVFYSAISLIVCLSALAGIYLLLDAQFIAAVQVIVYAGAIMVLFLFVIMLLDPFSSAPLPGKRRYLGLVGVLLGVSILAVLVRMAATYDASRVPRTARAAEAAAGGAHAIGRSIFTHYLLPFEATSALILVAIIGAVVLARRKG